jgi:hypothetical protein
MPSDLLQPDLNLSEHAALIEQRLDESASRLSPENLGELLGPSGREMASVTIAALPADSSSIWLVDAERTRLIVSHAEPPSDIINQEQSLNEGIVSLVLGSEQAICENRVYEHAQHSKQIDAALGTVTCAMIAVPFYVGGALRGVLSCVRLKASAEAPDPPAFTAANLSRVKRLSSAIEQLLNYRIVAGILGLEV